MASSGSTSDSDANAMRPFMHLNNFMQQTKMHCVNTTRPLDTKHNTKWYGELTSEDTSVPQYQHVAC